MRDEENRFLWRMELLEGTTPFLRLTQNLIHHLDQEFG